MQNSVSSQGRKTRKRRWLIKRAKNEFNVNPYKAGENLLDPKCYCSLNVDQEVLDQHKSSNLFDNNYDIQFRRPTTRTPSFQKI